MSPSSKHAEHECQVDGSWISVDGSLRLDLRHGYFTETHVFPGTRYAGRYLLRHRRLVLIDGDTGLRTSAALAPGCLYLRESTLVRLH
ncbi:hypothetical protein [Noviherbaspirillum aridicola]|uniref:Uncharacterized protein n=1 Tax=Noviherbaspirillum aridicola TaxID=2849687 RepID=A0ABQ4Q8G1_9BURK|nr:hypothetical protein [Noviherbaspirillum aridicola]GIZ53336.1 hypothetical protein NCCP691_33500 [Noviherbaspirillum aridicola]